MNDRLSSMARDVSGAQPGAPCLVLEEVSYSYPSGHCALARLNLRIGPGILGLLGPNGAGKSTLMRMLATLTRPTRGRILWNGSDVARDPNPLRASLGYLPQVFGAYAALTAREFLEYLAAVKGLPHAHTRARVDHCLQVVGLAEVQHRQIGACSGGMRQRVGIAQALLNDPALLVVDEPTVGLDPEERLRFRNLLTDLAGQRLVILSTHIVSDIEASATSLVVLDRGRVRFQGSPEALIGQSHGKVWDWTVPDSALDEVRARHHVCASLRRPDGVRVRIVGDRAPGSGAEAATPALEDAYMYLLAQPAPAAQ